MDAMRLLGGLLGNNSLGGSMGQQVLNTLARSMGGGSQRGGGNTAATLLGGLAVAAVQHYMRGDSGSSSAQGAYQSPGSSYNTQSTHSSSGGFSGYHRSSPSTPAMASMAGLSPPPLDMSRANQQAQLLVEAMIAAARADGKVDREEQNQIFSHLGGMGAEELQFVREIMARPVDLDDLARRTPAELGGALYAAALSAIRVDTPEESIFMHELATKLGLSPAELAETHRDLGLPPPLPPG